MVNAFNKRCLLDSCMRFPSFGVEGSNTAVYCKRHAVDGMAKVQYKRASHKSCTPRSARGVGTDVDTTACARRKVDVLDGSVLTVPSSSVVVDCRKRSRSELDRNQSLRGRDHDPFKDGAVVEVDGLVPRKGAPHTGSSVALRRHLHDSTTGTAARQPRQTMPNTVPAPLQQPQSLETIKTETETLVMF